MLPLRIALLAVGCVTAMPTAQGAGAHVETSLARSTHDAGAVFAMTNDPDCNEVVAFARASDGTLTQVGRHATGGRGQGVDFDTQGGLVLSKDHTFLYAVNPADDKVTVFAVTGSDLKVVQTIYAGDQPLAITITDSGENAYVLDGSVASTGIFGFKINKQDGTLSPLTNKTVPTSTPIGVPGTILFSPDSKAIIATNKVGSTVDLFAVDEDGLVGEGPVTVASSSGMRPFAATFDAAGNLYIIESGLPALGNAAVSSYTLGKTGLPSLSPITKSEKNGQTDGCWIVTTPDNKWAYTANFVSSTLSSYSIFSNGTASLLRGNEYSAGPMSEPVDLALSKDGKYLYNLLRGSGGVVALEIQKDGSLKQIGDVAGQNALSGNTGVSGLAAY